jgi:ABC-type multidrug transport system fused ATPase/permease subunit
MSDTSFVKDETLENSSGVFALNRRLFLSLPLFLKMLPFSIITLLLASAAPSLFRWYSGSLLNPTKADHVNSAPFDVHFTVKGLCWLTLTAILLRIASWAFFELSGMWSSQQIHIQMVRALSLTRTTFFDENPSGRLINRLIRDFDEVRSTAIIFVGDTCNASVEILSVSVVACLASPWAGLLILPLMLSFSYLQFQRSGMLDHARSLAAIATSQVLGRKNDLIEGREIYLLYGKAEKLLQRMSHSFRIYVQGYALTAQIESWGSFWIRISAEVFSFCVLIFVSFALATDHLTPALAGVIISSLFGITGSIGWLDFASGLVSRSTPHIRRVFEFVDLPREEVAERSPGLVAALQTSAPSLTGEILRPALISDHILSGDIVFRDYTMSYRKDTPIILNQLDLRVPVGTKVALVGRTGSGKTSIIQALMRMVYVHQGDILIGDQSIFDVDLLTLRRLFGVVPQVPYLFAGNIRTNLDRLEVLSAEAMQNALAAVGLNYSLDYKISEGGQNLSQGERQLVCLARVIAADRKIILMDEPTSGLDPETDARINRLLLHAFRDRTVVTIAHRKESLGNYDQIIEMRAGKRLGTV